MQHIPPNKLIKLVRKRIDSDGLTKVFDQITFRMLQKERRYQRRIECLSDEMRRMQRFVYALIKINNNQVNRNHTQVSAMKVFVFSLEYGSSNGSNIAE